MFSSSQLTLDVSKFDPLAVSDKDEEANNVVQKLSEQGPKWWEVGAAKYRQMRWNGETSLPAPVVHKEGKDSTIPSRDKGRDIPTRIFTPPKGEPRGVYLHIHGGGWVLQGEHYQDSTLKHLSESAQLTVVSIGYRLAPENPYPAGTDDCYDAAEWLVDNAKSHFGQELKFVGGESAGGHLTCMVVLHLIKSRPKFQFKGAVMNYGCFDLAGFLPQAHNFKRKLILDYDTMKAFVDAFVPNTTFEQRRDPAISPFYADLNTLAQSTPSRKLPPALFTCGTYDILLDDTLFMSTKWLVSRSEAVVKIYPGAPHGFTLFPPDSTDNTIQACKDTKQFLLEKLG